MVYGTREPGGLPQREATALTAAMCAPIADRAVEKNNVLDPAHAGSDAFLYEHTYMSAHGECMAAILEHFGKEREAFKSIIRVKPGLDFGPSSDCYSIPGTDFACL
jgi:hypothetical protein